MWNLLTSMASSLPCVRPPGPRDGRGQSQHQEVQEDHGDGICKDDDVDEIYVGKTNIKAKQVKKIMSLRAW